jgi:hypothetical protein
MRQRPAGSIRQFAMADSLESAFVISRDMSELSQKLETWFLWIIDGNATFAIMT